MVAALRSGVVLAAISGFVVSPCAAASEGHGGNELAEVRNWVKAAFTKTSPKDADHDRLIQLHCSHKLLKNRTVWGTPLQLGRRTFERGLYMDAPAAVRVQLTRPAVLFSATAGIDNNRSTQGNPEAGSARFHVEISGKSVGSTFMMRMHDEPAQVEIPLDGATDFVLRVDDGGNGRGWDQCSWAEACVRFADGTKCYLDELPLGSLRSIAPFSFVVDGEFCDTFLDHCERSYGSRRVDGKTVEAYTYQDPSSGLVFEFALTLYDDMPAVDWICHVENRGQEVSPLVENLLPVNVDLSEIARDTLVTLRWSQGDANCADAFLPHDDRLARNPGLAIDNCASGGRRIDLELCSRSYPLWRSDFNDIGEGLKGEEYWPRMGRASQVHVGGLSLYLPVHAGPLWSTSPYNVRSCMSGTVVLYDRILKDGFPDELARQGIGEVKELRPYFLGDYYPLMKLTAEQDTWWAYQLDRPDLGEGIVLAFRRPESQQTTATVQLQSIDVDSVYEVSVTGETYTHGAYQSMRGNAIQELQLTIPERLGSALMRYRRAGPTP